LDETREGLAVEAFAASIRLMNFSTSCMVDSAVRAQTVGGGKGKRSGICGTYRIPHVSGLAGIEYEGHIFPKRGVMLSKECYRYPVV
jgi:hypothetical protein